MKGLSSDWGNDQCYFTDTSWLSKSRSVRNSHLRNLKILLKAFILLLSLLQLINTHRHPDVITADTSYKCIIRVIENNAASATPRVHKRVRQHCAIGHKGSERKLAAWNWNYRPGYPDHPSDWTRAQSHRLTVTSCSSPKSNWRQLWTVIPHL